MRYETVDTEILMMVMDDEMSCVSICHWQLQGPRRTACQWVAWLRTRKTLMSISVCSYSTWIMQPQLEHIR